MNKQSIITILLALVAMAGQGQELKIDDQGELEIDVRSGSQSQIKRVSASLEDFMEHMAMYGYDVYTYDISSLRDSASGFTIVIREYDQQKMIDEKKLYGFRTKTMISDFNEKDQQEIYAENDADDMERGIYRLAKTLVVGFSPVQSDSIETITLRSSRCDASPWKLTLKPITEASPTVYRYQRVPYQPTSFSLDTFIPLVFYGSFWWDEQSKGWRFCGDTELTEEKAKTSQYFKYSPHYYIIGAIFHK